MAALGVGDADGVAVLGEIHSVGCDLGVCRVLKVHVYHTAGSARRLVHQTALLSVVDVLGILPRLCQRHRCHSAGVVVLVEDRPQQNLERRRGGQPAAGEHRRGGVGIKAGGLHAVLRQFRRNATNQCGRGALLRRLGFQPGQVDGIHGIALRLKPQLSVCPKRNHCHHIQLNGCR